MLYGDVVFHVCGVAAHHIHYTTHTHTHAYTTWYNKVEHVCHPKGFFTFAAGGTPWSTVTRRTPRTSSRRAMGGKAEASHRIITGEINQKN